MVDQLPTVGGDSGNQEATPVVIVASVQDGGLPVGPSNPLSLGKGQQIVTNCQIDLAASLSAAVDLGVARLVGVELPATFDGTAITFQGSVDGSNWYNVYFEGVEVSETVAASRRVVLDPAKYYGIRYVKVRAGTSAAPTVQATTATVLKLIAEA